MKLSRSDVRHRYRKLILGTNGLISCWPLDERQGTVARDLMSAMHGTYTSGPTLGIAGPVIDTPGGIATTVGSASYVTVPDSATLEPTNVTVEGWIKAASNATVHYVGRKESGSGYCLRLDTDGTAGHIKFYRANTLAKADGTTNLCDGLWHYAAGTFDGTTLRVYSDGTEAGNTVSATALAYDGANFVMGANSGEASDTSVAWVALYNRALPPSEIKLHYLMGLGA